MEKTVTAILLSFIVLASIVACKKNEPEKKENVVVINTDIPYINGDTTRRHKLDVYHAEGSSSNRVIVFVPGGAWRQGDKDLYGTLAETFVSLYNYTVVVTNYRLSNPEDGAAVHPNHINDVAAAFSWVMKNIASYGGDPGAVYLFGQSAGGHLVALLATDGQYLQQEGYSTGNIRGVIAMSGAYSLGDLVAYPLNPLGLNAEEALMYKSIVVNAFGSYDTATLNPASPMFNLQEEPPPFLVIYTELDMPGFGADALNFYSGVAGTGSRSVSVEKLFRADYSAETWETATAMASAEPAVSDYIGHYAEVVAINKHDHLKVPTKWIVSFIENH